MKALVMPFLLSLIAIVATGQLSNPVVGSGNGINHQNGGQIIPSVNIPAANILTLPKHNIKPTDTAGTVIYTRLTNTTNHSITLHPRLTPYQATDSASLIQGILAQVVPVNDADSMRIELIKAVGHYIKSPYKESFLPNFKEGANDTVTDEAYALIGADFTFPSWHCDNFCKEAIYLLEATKYFTDSDFILESCSIHTTIQVKMLNGDTVFVDMAVGMPVFMVADTAKQCGWASLSDILNNTALVNTKSQYYYVNAPGDSINLSPGRTIDNYSAIFYLPWSLNFYQASANTIDNFSGDFILAPGQTIEYRDTIGYLIDTTSTGATGMINTDLQLAAYYGVQGLINSDPDALDSALYYFYLPYSTLLNIPLNNAAALYDDSKVVLYNSSGNWSPSYLPQQSVLYSSIPASADTIYFGIQTSAPLLVTGNTYAYNGETVDSFNVDFYASGLFNSAPNLMGYQFNYANGFGVIQKLPPGFSARQTLLYNYNIFNFYTGGAMFTASDTGIVVEASSDVTAPLPANFNTNHIQAALAELPVIDTILPRHMLARETNDSACSIMNVAASDFSIYPNPASDRFYVCAGEITPNLTLHITDMTGKLIKSVAVTGNDNTVTIENIATGNYIISLHDGTGLVTEKTLTIMHR